MATEKLIKSLIKDDLINTKLVDGLNSLGLNAENYSLFLSETIINLMGFEDIDENDSVHHFYIDYTKKAKNLDINNYNNSFDKLADEIYQSLKTLKTVE